MARAVPCASANPATAAVTTAAPLPKRSWSTVVTSTVAVRMPATTNEAASCNGRRCTGSSSPANAPAPRRDNHHTSPTSTSAATAIGHNRAPARLRSTTSTMATTCTHVEMLAASAPASAGRCTSGDADVTVRASIAVVADADTNPPAMPVTTSPRWVPSTRVPTQPTHPIAASTTTSRQSSFGLITPHRSMSRSGSSGSTMSVIAKNLRASSTSTSVTTSRTKWATRDFCSSSNATATPAPAAIARSRWQ